MNQTQSYKNVAKVFTPTTVPEGDGLLVTRIIGISSFEIFLLNTFH